MLAIHDTLVMIPEGKSGVCICFHFLELATASALLTLSGNCVFNGAGIFSLYF